MNHKMRRNPRKRRKSSKTNYKKRLALLKSGTPRLVVRKTNTRMITQLINYEPDGDKVLLTVSSSELKGQGWKGSFKNTPACYLTGRLIASKAKKAGVKKAVLDIGLHTPKKGCRVFAVAKGAAEGGLDVPVSEEVFPSQERIDGSHLKKDVKKEVQQIISKM